MFNVQLINFKSSLFFSKNIFVFLFTIQILNINQIYSNNYITLPFTYINSKSYESNSTSKKYFESLITYPVFTTLKINNKDVTFHITLDRYSTYISEKTAKEIIPEESKEEKLYSLDYIGIHRAKLQTSTFSFISNTSKNISFNNYSFFMTTQINNSSDYEIKRHGLITETEEIGLKIVKGNKYDKIEVE